MEDIAEEKVKSATRTGSYSSQSSYLVLTFIDWLEEANLGMATEKGEKGKNQELDVEAKGRAAMVNNAAHIKCHEN